MTIFLFKGHGEAVIPLRFARIGIHKILAFQGLKGAFFVKFLGFLIDWPDALGRIKDRSKLRNSDSCNQF